MTKAARISYVFIALLLVMLGWLHLTTPFLAVLFSYFFLHKLHVTQSKWVAVALFLLAAVGIVYATGYFVRIAVVALPKIAETSIPSFINWATVYGIELPFTDYDSLKNLAMETVTEQVHYLRNVANFAKGAATEAVFVVIGVVVAVSLFLDNRLDLDAGKHPVKNNLYSSCCSEISSRFLSFYESFATVLGAQIIISSINTTLTSIFVFVGGLPYWPLLIGATFLCGLLPVVGNLISNTIIVGVAFTISPKMALTAMAFLVVVHKLEYFLNSKIIGDRIRNPIWLTLLGLIIGERLLGIPGMILAPVVLNYVKMEASRVPVNEKA